MDVEEKDIPPILLRLFDEYRRARMNCLYYGARLRMITGCNRWAEIVLAITSSVTVASWYIWTTGPGMYIWMILGVLSTILCIVKPIMNWAKDIERYNKLWAGYTELFHDLHRWVQQSKHARPTNSAELESTLEGGANKLKILEVQDDVSPNQRLLKRCQDQVNREIPPEGLWPAWLKGD